MTDPIADPTADPTAAPIARTDPGTTPFIARRLDLPADAFDDEGCLTLEDLGALRGARLLAQSCLDAARAEADAERDAARAEAARVRAEAAAAALQLQADHQAAWRAAEEQLEACAVAIARAALLRLGHEMDDAQQLRAAVRSAVKALPEAPVRLLVPGAADAAEWPIEAGVEVIPGAAEAGSLTVCGTARDVAVDLAAARWEVQRSLGAWLREQLAQDDTTAAITSRSEAAAVDPSAADLAN